MEQEKVLEVEKLHAVFRIDKKEYEVLHDISFTVHRNETVCIVGESGCGKSVTTLCIMGLLPKKRQDHIREDFTGWAESCWAFG